MRLAREVQQSLLPPAGLALPEVEVVGRFLPSWALGGDFYDYFVLDESRVVLYLGDVQGKGLGGALHALLVSGLLRGMRKADRRPSEVLAFLNQRLAVHAPPGRFACLTYAAFHRSSRQLAIANAGLPFPLLLRDGTISRVELRGMPVGMFSESVFAETDVPLRSGDRLLFYTDGLSDSLATRRSREDGPGKVAGILARFEKEPAIRLGDALLETVRGKGARKLPDDVSFIVLQVH